MRYHDIKKGKLAELLVPQRLDIIVKYLYIMALNTDTKIDFFKNLYIKHILKRTGGKQNIYEYINGKTEIAGNKYGVEQYLNDFHKLFKSIKTDGFRQEYFIPVSALNGIILDGSHRLACCLYLNLNPLVKYEEREGKSWGYDWFINNDFNTTELNFLVNSYFKFKKKQTFSLILWGSTKDSWLDIEKLISRDYSIIMSKAFNFSQKAMGTLINDIYSHEFGVFLPDKIRNKINLLNKYDSSLRLIVIDVSDPEYELINNRFTCSQILHLKETIRGMLSNSLPKELFITVHTSDNPDHTEHILNIFLNENNMSHLFLRKEEFIRDKFIGWLLELEEVLNKYGLTKNDCCIVGSGPLEITGIRKATDIDIIISKEKRRLFFASESQSLSTNVDLAHLGYHEYRNNNKPLSDDEIISNKDNHFFFRGFKFANIEIIKTRKENQKRAKDIEDIKLIKKNFSGAGDN